MLQVTILWCKECGRYLQPPKHWVRAEPESKELLTFCTKRIKGLQVRAAAAAAAGGRRAQQGLKRGVPRGCVSGASWGCGWGACVDCPMLVLAGVFVFECCV
jgi:hypothetical protein